MNKFIEYVCYSEIESIKTQEKLLEGGLKRWDGENKPYKSRCKVFPTYLYADDKEFYHRANGDRMRQRRKIKETREGTGVFDMDKFLEL